jgi:hypothetical protein
MAAEQLVGQASLLLRRDLGQLEHVALDLDAALWVTGKPELNDTHDGPEQPRLCDGDDQCAQCNEINRTSARWRLPCPRQLDRLDVEFSNSRRSSKVASATSSASASDQISTRTASLGRPFPCRLVVSPPRTRARARDIIIVA